MHGEFQWTYAQLQARVQELARWLGTLQLPEGARIADLHPNGVETVLSDFACSAADMVRVALNHNYTTDELRGIVEHVGASVLLTSPKLYHKLGNNGSASGARTFSIRRAGWQAPERPARRPLLNRRPAGGRQL